MADLADVADVENLYQPVADDDLRRVEGLIRYASSVVRASVPGLDRRVERGTLDAQVVADVVAMMVIRALRNPGGVTQETIGPVSYSVDANVGSGYVFLSDAERALLAPTASAGASSGPRGVGMIRLTPALGFAKGRPSTWR